MKLAVLLLIALVAAQSQDADPAGGTSEKWKALFDGKSLEGWTPKIRGYELGENFADTFRVKGGVIEVGYEGYDGDFDGRFGHLFWKESYSHYRMRLEYRFIGDQAKGGPGWAFRNSGIMIHGQAPETMTQDQEFPVSIEVQLLGGNGKDARPNANLCTPGTNVVMNERLVTQHCINSKSKTYHGDEWVTVEIEVRGNEVILHRIDGEVVLEYQKPQLDPNDKDGKRLIEARNGEMMLSGGSISLQSESHPVQFRKVEILVLEQ
ncbi:MAG: DUF1080 domain-containing protein [Planctomycetota bacterium]